MRRSDSAADRSRRARRDGSCRDRLAAKDPPVIEPEFTGGSSPTQLLRSLMGRVRARYVYHHDRNGCFLEFVSTIAVCDDADLGCLVIAGSVLLRNRSMASSGRGPRSTTSPTLR